jgi:hypothetical protein
MIFPDAIRDNTCGERMSHYCFRKLQSATAVFKGSRIAVIEYLQKPSWHFVAEVVRTTAQMQVQIRRSTAFGHTMEKGKLRRSRLFKSGEFRLKFLQL